LRDVQREATKKAEADIILRALEITNWNRKKAAAALTLSYKALLYKIKELALDKRFASMGA
jgi:two-component system response regulator AtoC